MRAGAAAGARGAASGSGPRKAAALDNDEASACAELVARLSSSAFLFFASWDWFFLRSMFCFTSGRLRSYRRLPGTSQHSPCYVDSSLPGKQCSVGVARLQVRHIVVLREKMLAEHVSPYLGEVLAVLKGESFNATRMIKVNKLCQPVLMFGLGGDAS